LKTTTLSLAVVRKVKKMSQLTITPPVTLAYRSYRNMSMYNIKRLYRGWEAALGYYRLKTNKSGGKPPPPRFEQ
jgi:hypothetical protein